LWKRKHFEERSWKRKQTRKRLTLYGAESGSKKYSIASTSLFQIHFHEKLKSRGQIYCHALTYMWQVRI